MTSLPRNLALVASCLAMLFRPDQAQAGTFETTIACTPHQAAQAFASAAGAPPSSGRPAKEDAYNTSVVGTADERRYLVDFSFTGADRVEGVNIVNCQSKVKVRVTDQGAFGESGAQRSAREFIERALGRASAQCARTCGPLNSARASLARAEARQRREAAAAEEARKAAEAKARELARQTEARDSAAARCRNAGLGALERYDNCYSVLQIMQESSVLQMPGRPEEFASISSTLAAPAAAEREARARSAAAAERRRAEREARCVTWCYDRKTKSTAMSKSVDSCYMMEWGDWEKVKTVCND